jgi:hypothetical protein
MNTQGDNRLPAITEEIREAHRNYKKNIRQAAEYVHKVGVLLNEAKEYIGHGRFGDYIKTNFPFSIRTADNYMKLADRGVSAAKIAILGQAGALKELDDYHYRKRMDEADPERAERRSGKKRRRKFKYIPRDPDAPKRPKFQLPIKRPSDFQLLYVNGEANDKHWTAYIWREMPVGPYENSSKAFRYIICHEAGEGFSRRGEAKIDRGLQSWDEITAMLGSHLNSMEIQNGWDDNGPTGTGISARGTIPASMRQEIWDIDLQTTQQVLDHWRNQIGLDQTNAVLGRWSEREDDPDPPAAKEASSRRGADAGRG